MRATLSARVYDRLMMRIACVVLVIAACGGPPSLPDPRPEGTVENPLPCVGGGACGCSSGSCTGDCGGDAACAADCSGGLCDVTCNSSVGCTLNCSGGRCIFYCAEHVPCTLDCSGGNCSAWCPSGTSCAFNCSGGGCTFACDGPCTYDCSRAAARARAAGVPPDSEARRACRNRLRQLAEARSRCGQFRFSGRRVRTVGRWPRLLQDVARGPAVGSGVLSDRRVAAGADSEWHGVQGDRRQHVRRDVVGRA